jgi:sigma-B regulation protein RsbU (phosphoserine phosphatase)
MSDFVLKILVVEDDPVDAESVVRSLRQGLPMKFEVEISSTLTNAIDGLKQRSVGLVFTDLHLPDSDGLATFQRLKEAASGTPIVVVSGLEDVKIASAALQQGAQDYVVKGQAPPATLPRVAHFAVERSRRIVAERERDRVLHDLEVAREIQQSLYPDEITELPGLDIAGAVWSADQACGDYYDFFRTRDGNFTIALGDVCGHGLPAALSMLQVRTALRLLARQGTDPCEILSGVNETIFVEDDAFPRFVSLFVGQLDVTNHTLRYATAGHAGYVLRANGNTERLSSMTMVLGVGKDLASPGTSNMISLQKGDTLFVPTDGFSEAATEDRKLFGIKRTLDTVQNSTHLSASGMIQRLRDEVMAFTDGRIPEDDMTALIVKAT